MTSTVAHKLGTGLLYGLGFVLGLIVVAGVLFIAGNFYINTNGGSIGYSTRSPRAPPPTFVITNTNAIKTTWGGFEILGTIENPGEATDRHVNVYADLFDSEGKFIFQCKHQFLYGLRKGEIANFMIECRGMPKDLFERYASFKVVARAD